MPDPDPMGTDCMRLLKTSSFLLQTWLFAPVTGAQEKRDIIYILLDNRGRAELSPQDGSVAKPRLIPWPSNHRRP